MLLLKSAIRYRSHGRISPISAVAGVKLFAVSREECWSGVHVEVGVSSSWNGEDTMVDGHFVTLNTSHEPLVLEQRGEGSGAWTPIARLPNALMINPEGRPFSYRHWKGLNSWNVVVVDGKFLDTIMGQHYELRGAENIIDDNLSQLVRRMAQRVVDGEIGDTAYIRSLVCSFVIALASTYGVPTANTAPKGGLAPLLLKKLLNWIHSQIESPITVGQMAALAGLSEAHFAREFKRSMNKTPWEYVVEYRLAMASRLLAAGEPVATTAIRCGFFDQAHLSRQFKRHYGMSPSCYAREHLQSFSTPHSDLHITRNKLAGLLNSTQI